MSPSAELQRRLLRPSLETKYHIDYAYWERSDRDLDVYMRSHLCDEHQESYADVAPDAKVDSVDPETGEVTRVNGIENILRTHCSQQSDYLTPQTSLVNAIFRVFLANGNQPLSAQELGDRLSRSPKMILRTLSGPRVYKGIRPYIPVED